MDSLVNIAHVSTFPDNNEIKGLNSDHAAFLRKKLKLEEKADLSAWETKDGKVFMKANKDETGKLTSFEFIEILSKTDKDTLKKYENDKLETISFTLTPSANNLDTELLKKAAYTAGKQFRSINKQIDGDGDIKTRIEQLKTKPISIQVSIDKDTIAGINSSGSDQLARMKIIWEGKILSKTSEIERNNNDEFNARKKKRKKNEKELNLENFYWQVKNTELYKKSGNQIILKQRTESRPSSPVNGNTSEEKLGNDAPKSPSTLD